MAAIASMPVCWAIFLFLLPECLDYKQALVLTAGMTTAMGLRQLEENGLTPQMGPILVTGASGGVGSVAISLLSKRGYTVAASTGKPDACDYLRQLGASEILSREEVSADSTRPLEAERLAGASTPLEVRRELWEEITREETLLKLVDSITTEVTLEEIPRVTGGILGGQMRGRILVWPSEQ